VSYGLHILSAPRPAGYQGERQHGLGRYPVERSGRKRIGTKGVSKRRFRLREAVVLTLGLVMYPELAWSGTASSRTSEASVNAFAPGAPRLTAIAPETRDPAPEPGLGPDAVVGIVLHALQYNDNPVTDHGIAVTFAFTSPENHDVTGPIDRFRALVKSSAYRSMIGHARADRGPVVVVAEHARERVAITGAHGEHAVFLFLLSRQEAGVYKGCWMADGVLREADAVLDDTRRRLVTPVVLQRD
jgi:hypothetical protein